MLSDFVSNLLSGQPLRIGAPEVPSEGDVKESLQKIRAFERDWRIELPGVAPDLDMAAVSWSVISIYLASSLVIHRDIGGEEIEALLNREPPDRNRVESHYSVDLTMRFLPDVLRLSKTESQDDPLHTHLLKWGHDWPLSSVGIQNLGAIDASPLRTSETIMRLYVDRIFAQQDVGRLDDCVVQRMATEVLGHYPDLNSGIANAIQEKLQPIQTDRYSNDDNELQ